MKFFTIVLAALPLILFCAPASADSEDATTLTATTIQPLAQWVEQATHTQMQALPITVVSNAKLKMALSLHGVQQARAAGAYLPGRIYLSDAVWEPGSLRAQSYLVHELVHHAQLVSRRQYPCPAAKEREAYTLQNAWLEQHGEQPVVSQEWIDRISSCANPGAGDGD